MTVMELEAVKSRVSAAFDALVKRRARGFNAHLLVHSDTLGVHWSFAHGGSSDQSTSYPDQCYHTASIGKTFTAVMIAMLVEQGKLAYTDVISNYISPQLMESLHVHKGIDYSEVLTVSHLLAHTSGLPDYYEGKNEQGTFIQQLLSEPDRIWKPDEAVHWSKQHQVPKFTPGKRCSYSDTNYNLLGLIIESVTGKAYAEVLHHMIFDPLGMRHSYLSQYSLPKEVSSYPIAKLKINSSEIDVEALKSSSSVFAAGGTVSTSEDLLTFLKALHEGRLISKKALVEMQQWRAMRIGIQYGYGLMNIKMNPFTSKFDMWGHLGSTGSFMLYNEALDIYTVGSYNQTGMTGSSIRYVFGVLKQLDKLKKAKVNL